jgi:nucleoside-diphosphate-sugar epimerase
MKRVLVTGAAGFVGLHCLPLLAARDYEIHAVSARAQQKDYAGVRWHQADLLDALQVAELMAKVRPTHLLHLAWFTVPGQYWTSLENVRWVQASLNLFQEFHRNKGARAVMAGTCAEYDWRYGYCSERLTPLSPATLYGTCKHSLQLILDALARELSTSLAWGRIFFLYGPNEPPQRLVPYLIRGMLRGDAVRCSHGNQIRDFLFIEDVAGAFVALLESDVSGPVNIASGEGIAVKELVYRIAQQLSARDLVELGAVPLSEGEPPLLVADIRRLKEEVGWTPRYGLEQGLERTIKWWKERILEDNS